MLNTGIFPDKLKIAKIIPIYKQEDETLYFNQLYEFFVKHKLFYNAQLIWFLHGTFY